MQTYVDLHYSNNNYKVALKCSVLSMEMENLCYDDKKDRSDLIKIFKIISGYFDINADLFFEFDEGMRRGHSRKSKEEFLDKHYLVKTESWRYLSLTTS